jgi:hypothetical protein
MSGGLFGKTNYSPVNPISIGAVNQFNGAGYGLLKPETEQNYKETKRINDKFGYLTQPTKTFIENPLEAFKINSISTDLHAQYALNASYYNGLIGKQDDFVYNRQLYIPPSYPNHFYNPQKTAPVLDGISNPAYPI